MRTGSWMRRMVDAAVAVLAVVCAWTASGAEIRNVTARQRFPWNGKVDISYEVVGSVSSIEISATDKTTGRTYGALPSALSGDTGGGAGVHKAVWDLSAQWIELHSENVVFAVEGYPLYCVIDLSGSSSASSYPVTYLDAEPSGGFNVDVYKTTKLVLRLIDRGSYIMGNDQTDESHRVTLTKPFYIGVFEVTQKQYRLVMGSNPSKFSGDKRPVEQVSYSTIRGSSNGSQWPSSSSVDSSSFLGKLRARTGLEFDLPTEAQWEYACRAGTTSDYNNGGSTTNDLKQVGRYWDNSSDNKGGYSSYHTTVGSYQPNAWGLYDMHGNVLEWCLDWDGDRMLAYGTDPKGSSSGSYRVLRGGSWSIITGSCTSSFRYYYRPSDESINFYGYYGFRLVRTLSE
ncbi:MAG: formylglycine-generating enzyme family protein [Kiritimatiellae bacterium]|nr:formylglycine-generating enzyme family protein [Kiritimatiellia bacterium]